MIFRNHEHYSDPTAGEAIRRVMLEQAGMIGRSGELRMIREEEYGALRGFGGLAEQIVLRAAEDYRAALKDLLENPRDFEARAAKAKIEHFFRKGWFRKVYQIEGDYMIRKLKEESGWTE